MLHENFKNSLKSIDDELRSIEYRREHLIKESRNIIILCSQSIIDLHRNQVQESQSKINKATELLKSLKVYAQNDLLRYLYVPEQELVEASFLMRIAKDGSLPGLEEMQVSSQSYLLGLLDCIGEIKRMVYDKVRSGNYKDAEFLFEQMQGIYVEIYPFAVYDNLISGIRKKLDVCKILIENTRELITEESRHFIMIQALDNFNKKFDLTK